MLDISVRYSNERVAFEKKISKFRRCQHNLARLRGTGGGRSRCDLAADTIANSTSFDDAAFLEARPRNRMFEARKRAARIASGDMARSASRSSTSCIAMLRALAWRDDFGSEKLLGGGTRKISPRAAPTNCGRCGVALTPVDLPATKVETKTMTAALRFDPIACRPNARCCAKQVACLPRREIAAGPSIRHKPNREDTDGRNFPRVGERGWLGMTWPKNMRHERSFLERYVVTEEMRVANAPTRRFFVADRQSGPGAF